MQIEMRIVIFLFTQYAILCRFNKLTFANSNRQTLRTPDILGENHDSYLKQIWEDYKGKWRIAPPWRNDQESK